MKLLKSVFTMLILGMGTGRLILKFINSFKLVVLSKNSKVPSHRGIIRKSKLDNSQITSFRANLSLFKN